LRPQEESYSWQGGSGQSGQFFDQARSYDAASNVTGASTTIGAYSESANYCYDEQNRLVWAGNSGTQPGAGSGTCGSLTLANSFPGVSYSNTFSYTNLGQLWHAPLNGSGNTQQYLYCSGNSHQLQGVYPTGASCSNPGTATYSAGYDAWGNLTSRTYNNQTATLSYDPLDQLVEWQVPGTSQAWYGYDSSGQRSLQRSVVGSTTSLTVYAFGLEEYHYDGSGNLQSSTHYYTLAGRLLGELQVNGSTQTTNYFLSDGLGSVLGVFSNTASSASLLASQLYAPYGASRYGSGTVSPYTTKGFTGQYNDPTSGLDYDGARYYDPVVGLFVSADKQLGDMQGANPYEYVGQNPETNNDPTGQYFVPGGGNGSGSPPPRPTIPPANPPASPPCTISNCSVTLNQHSYSLGDILTNLNLRERFLMDFYSALAPGFGVAELDFFEYLLNSGRLKDLSGYWNSVDYDIARDQLLAAYDYLHHQGAQNPLVAHWLAFLTHPGDNAWWIAHNDSINAGDEQARADGVYEKENPVERIFINQAVHVINDIQYISEGNGNPFSGWLGPRSPVTGDLARLLDPQQNDPWTTGKALVVQGLVAGGVGAIGGGLVGGIVGAIATGGPGAPFGAIIGGLVGITAGETFFQGLLAPTS